MLESRSVIGIWGVLRLLRPGGSVVRVRRVLEARSTPIPRLAVVILLQRNEGAGIGDPTSTWTKVCPSGGGRRDWIERAGSGTGTSPFRHDANDCTHDGNESNTTDDYTYDYAKMAV